MASYFNVGVQFCSINGGSRSLIHPRILQTHIHACLSQQLCFFFSERIKQACTCPGVVLWTTGPATDRFLKNISLFPMDLCHCLLDCPLLSLFVFFNPPVHPQTGSYLIISNSFTPTLWESCRLFSSCLPLTQLKKWQNQLCLSCSIKVCSPTRSHSPSLLYFLYSSFFSY